MMKQIAILDDDQAFAQELARETDRFFTGACQINVYHSADALREATANAYPDIALLDIQLNEENGISLARELFPAHCGTAVIFITGYMEYCTDVYEAEHIYFLLKPLQPRWPGRFPRPWMPFRPRRSFFPFTPGVWSGGLTCPKCSTLRASIESCGSA